jgi:hypothetical protein
LPASLGGLRKAVNANTVGQMGRKIGYSRVLGVAVALLGLAGCELTREPQGHGPQWIERPVSTLTDKMGKPDRLVPLPPPSLATAYIYGLGTTPGYSLCERDYYVKGLTVIGYSEHGVDPNCHRSAGRTD